MRKPALRLCSQSLQIVCQVCKDIPDCISNIDMVGRILTINNKQYYFAPCCASVQPYMGTGQDFAPPKSYYNTTTTCQHLLAKSTQQQNNKKKKKVF